MDRWGGVGPVFYHFLLGTRETTPSIMNYDAIEWPNAQKMNQLAVSTAVPYGILNTANKCWKESHPDTWYGDSYMDADPKTWALQRLGLGWTRALIRHIHEMDARANDPSAKLVYKARQRNKCREKAVAAAHEAEELTSIEPNPHPSPYQ